MRIEKKVFFLLVEIPCMIWHSKCISQHPLQNGCRHERWEKSTVGWLTAQTSQNVNLELWAGCCCCCCCTVDVDACGKVETKVLELRFLIASSADQRLSCSKILDSDGEIWKKRLTSFKQQQYWKKKIYKFLEQYW